MKKLLTYLSPRKHLLLYFPILLLFSLSFVDCAKRGRPAGGLKDTLAPVIVKSTPENYSTNFDGNEIRIYFDEYIKLKDIQKNLIISPPLDYAPIITPLNTSKQLRIKILDTLKENTTYSFNFGKSIIDNNEENEFPYYKYVISTGNYIDSLQLSGTVSDALLPEIETPVSIVLYELDENFTDSLIYTEKPRYITTIQDSISTFQLTNLKEGNYLLLALKERNNDYTFQPTSDKIAFLKDTIRLPTDTNYSLTLFKEIPEYTVTRPTHQSKNEILFGYTGLADSLRIQPLSQVPTGYVSRVYKDADRDTLHYWFKPAFDSEVTDSILFLATNRSATDTLNVRIRNLFVDSLNIGVYKGGTLVPRDTFQLALNTPLTAIDNEYITVLDKDSIMVPIVTKVDTNYNRAHIWFEKSLEQRYNITLTPGALIDFFEATNDTLRYLVSTKAEDDYGYITFGVENGKEFPIIVELIDERFQVLQREIISENRKVNFNFLNPGDYYIRLVFDENNNQIWDTGNFLERKQPERVLYYPEPIEVRANWYPIVTFPLN